MRRDLINMQCCSLTIICVTLMMGCHVITIEYTEIHDLHGSVTCNSVNTQSNLKAVLRDCSKSTKMQSLKTCGLLTLVHYSENALLGSERVVA